MVNILSKLGGKSRLQALVFALRHGAVKIECCHLLSPSVHHLRDARDLLVCYAWTREKPRDTLHAAIAHMHTHFDDGEVPAPMMH